MHRAPFNFCSQEAAVGGGNVHSSWKKTRDDLELFGFHHF